MKIKRWGGQAVKKKSLNPLVRSSQFLGFSKILQREGVELKVA